MDPHQQAALSVVNSAAPSATPTPANQPNAFERLLPTIGGVAGGVLGDILPGGPLTGVAGAAGGGALGKFIEDKLTGQGGGNGVLESAIANGLGQGVGAGVSAIGGAALGGATKALGSVVDRNAATAEVATKAATDANNAANKQALYGEAVKAAHDPAIGSNFQTTLDSAEKYGINTLDPNAPKLMSQVGHSQTGGNIEQGSGALNEKVNQIIGEHGANVNLGGISDELTQSVGNLNSASGTSGTLDLMVSKGKKISPANNPAQQAVQQIAQLSPKLSTAGGTGLVASEMTSAEADSLAKGLQKIAFSKEPTASTGFQDPVALAKQRIANDLYNYVRGEVDRQPGLGAAVQGIKNDPALESFVDSKVSAISDPAIQAATKAKLLNDFKGANTIQDLRAAQAEAVQLSKLGDHVSEFNGQRTYTTGAAKREPVNLKQDSGVPPTNPVLDAASVLAAPATHDLSLIGLAPHAINAAKNPAVVDAAHQALTKVTGSAVAKKVVPALIKSGAIAGSNLPNDAAGPISAIPGGQADNMGGNPMQPQVMQDNPLNQAYQIALAGAGISPGSAGILQALAPALQKQQLAQPLVTGAENAYQNAGGAQGFAGGALSQLTSAIPGSAANVYQHQQTGAADALASLLGITPQAALQLMPSLMQTGPTAANSTGTINSILGGIGTQMPSSAIPVASAQ